MNVVSLPDRKKPDPQEMNRRRMALQIAAQLPADAVEALLVLEATMLLVKTFFTLDGA